MTYPGVQDMRRVHVVIVNYFSFELVVRLLSSLDFASYSSVCVVDNSASDLEYGRLQVEFSPKGVRVVSAEKNIGFGAAVNLGVSNCPVEDSDFVWILNPDTVLGQNGGQELAAVMDEYSADLASPLLTTGIDSESIWFGGGEFVYSRGRTQHWASRSTSVEEVSFLTGAALMLRGSAWRELVGFREDLFMYWEDADLCLRARSCNMKMIIAPDITVWHAVGATSSSRGRSELFYYYMQRNRTLVLCENFSFMYLLGAGRLIETAVMAARALKEDRGSVTKFISSLRGLAAGLRVQAYRLSPRVRYFSRRP